jgi:hypothetical protein
MYALLDHIPFSLLCNFSELNAVIMYSIYSQPVHIPANVYAYKQTFQKSKAVYLHVYFMFRPWG